VFRTESHCAAIRYTPYARRQMRQRRIPPSDVEAAMADPQIRYPDQAGRIIVRSRIRGRRLCVVYEVRETDCLVISAYLLDEEDDEAA